MLTTGFGITDHTLRDATDDHLDLVLADTQAMIDRARTLQLAVIGEKDRRQAHTADGYRTLAEWVAARLDECPDTAKDLVRTARSIPTDVADALAEGVIGYRRAVETARLANSGVADAVEEGWAYDIVGLRRRVSAQRAVTPADERDVYDRRHVVLQPNLDESSWRLFGLLPGTEGAAVATALEARADLFPSNHATVAQRNADALVSLATDTLTSSSGENPTGMVSVFVDATDATPTNGQRGMRISGGPRIGARALASILCEGTVEVIATTRDGKLIDLGGGHVIPPRARRAVLARDHGHCVIAGCTSRYRIQVHHLHPQTLGGSHHLENLVTVCWYHHHVAIHGNGMTVSPDSPPHARRLLRPTANGPPA